MEYNINNVAILTNGTDRSYLETHLERFMKKMTLIPNKYKKSNTIDINLSITDSEKFKIGVSAYLNTCKVYCNLEGEKIQEIVPEIFSIFSKKIASEINNIRKQFSLDQKNTFLKLTALDKQHLLSLNKAEINKLFNSLIPVFLPSLKGYIKRRIMSAKLAEIQTLSNVDSKDIVNDVVVKVYPLFEKEIENIKDLNIWLIQTADIVLNKILESAESDNISFEELVNSELGQLEEEYTIDGGGDLIMTDELDEYDNELGIEEILISSSEENSFIENLDISKSTLKDKIYDELIKLPLKYQSIYDLYFFEYLDFEEIGIIKDMDATEIEAIIISVKELLTEKLFN